MHGPLGSVEEAGKVAFRDVEWKFSGYPGGAVQEEVIYMGLELSFTFWPMGSNLGHFVIQSCNVNLINLCYVV